MFLKIMPAQASAPPWDFCSESLFSQFLSFFPFIFLFLLLFTKYHLSLDCFPLLRINDEVDIADF